MPNTANRGYTYPDSNGATEIWEHFQELAEDIDTDVEAVSDAVAARFLYVAKGSTESVTSSTVLQGDNELVLTLPIGIWATEAVLSVTGAAAGDVKIAWTFSGTLTGNHGRTSVGPQLGTTDALSTSMMSTQPGLGSASAYGVDGSRESVIIEKLLLQVTASGLLELLWAQNASSGTATNMLTGSRITAIKVG